MGATALAYLDFGGRASAGRYVIAFWQHHVDLAATFDATRLADNFDTTLAAIGGYSKGKPRRLKGGGVRAL